MEQKQLTKQENILNLYSQLNMSGQRGEAVAFIAKIGGVKKGTVKNHWVKELPDHLTDNQLDQIISYLQNQIANNNIIVG